MRLSPAVARIGLRLRPRLPDPVWQGLLEVGSLVTDVPAIGLPDFRRVLVLAPHPDDETIGCGGTVARLTARGAEVLVVVATDGEATVGAASRPAEIARRRRNEVTAACRTLGVERAPWFLGLPDGGLVHHGRALTGSAQEALDELRPQVVLTPWLLDGHPDHRAVTAALARATPPEPVQVWGYGAHTPVVATRVVPTSDVLDRKRTALEQHETAAAAFDLTATLGLDRWWSLATDAGRGHAEAFHAATWEDFVSLAALPSVRRSP